MLRLRAVDEHSETNVSNMKANTITGIATLIADYRQITLAC